MLEALEEMDEEILLFSEMNDALIGWTKPMNSPVLAVYDYRKLVDVVMEISECSVDEAEEYVDYNVLGAYMGPGTPIVVISPDVD